MLRQGPPSIYQSPKCFVTYGSMGHIDPKQIPRKAKPWSTLLALDFVHKVDLVIPQEIYRIVHQQLVDEKPPPCYYRVTMALGQILEGAFFTEYIKRGNILMLSEGNPMVDDTFMLKDGVLTMFLCRETYERAGLVGKPYGVKDNRGLKPQWIVSYDLRSPSMLHGKKGFDRLLYACRKVLDQPVAWLFCNVDKTVLKPDPLEQFFPVKFTSSPGIARDIVTRGGPLTVSRQTLATGDRSELETLVTDMYEWLSLIRLGSPRVEAKDKIDPYLSRYQAPNEVAGDMAVCKMSWQGFISTQWLCGLLVALLTTCPSQSWFCLSATELSKNMSNGGNELMLLRPTDAADEYLMWEIKTPL